MSSVYLVRHGQAGTRDSYDSLSELGQRQSLLLGEYFLSQGIEFTAAYAGTMLRQQQTAAVNRGGENVYCVEVENVLAAHPAVFEVAVVGVPDKMMGEKVGALIVTKPGSKAEPGEIVEFARTRLADFKIPQYMIVRSEMLPRNPSGKVLK